MENHAYRIKVSSSNPLYSTKVPYLPHASPFFLNESKYLTAQLAKEEKQARQERIAAQQDAAQKDFEEHYLRWRGELPVPAQTPRQAHVFDILNTKVSDVRTPENTYDAIKMPKALG